MKKVLLILFALITLSFYSCRESESSERSHHVCNCEQREKVAEFVQSSIKASNNMADEEMEDVIAELRRTAIAIYCPQRTVWMKNAMRDIVDTTLTKLDSCESIMYMYR